jgi:opacity protein-like surface antigen
MHVLLGRRRIKTTALITVALAAVAATAFAEFDYKWKDGPHVGFATGSDVRNEDFAFGWQAACELTEFFSIELSATRQTDEIQERLDVLPIPPEFNIDLELYAIALTGRLTLRPVDIVTLYAAAGVGYYIFKTDSEEIRVISASRVEEEFPQTVLRNMNVDVENDFAFHVAAGIELALDEHWEIFAEYRAVSLDSDARLEITEQVREDYFAGPEFSEDRLLDKLEYDHGLVRVGVNYRF